MAKAVVNTFFALGESMVLPLTALFFLSLFITMTRAK